MLRQITAGLTLFPVNFLLGAQCLSTTRRSQHGCDLGVSTLKTDAGGGRFGSGRVRHRSRSPGWTMGRTVLLLLLLGLLWLGADVLGSGETQQCICTAGALHTCTRLTPFCGSHCAEISRQPRCTFPPVQVEVLLCCLCVTLVMCPD